MAGRQSLKQVLGIRRPVLLAPMAFVSGGKLAAAVSRSGGLGLVGGGYCEKQWVENEMREANGARVGVGFITWKLQQAPEVLECALAFRPAAVLLSFGDCSQFVATIKQAGARVICQVQSVEGAVAAVAAGADVIVAQGNEAGGHGAECGQSTLTLLPAVLDAVTEVPVVAAGGVGDGRGLAAVMAIGAGGAMVGTRFHASKEALGDEAAKTKIVEASGGVTMKGRVVDGLRGREWPPGYALRTLENPFLKEATEACEGEKERQYGAEYAAAATAGDYEKAAVVAGEAAGLVRSLLPAADIMDDMIRTARVHLETRHDLE